MTTTIQSSLKFIFSASAAPKSQRTIIDYTHYRQYRRNARGQYQHSKATCFHIQHAVLGSAQTLGSAACRLIRHPTERLATSIFLKDFHHSPFGGPHRRVPAPTPPTGLPHPLYSLQENP
jgi:hypothetical protein